MFERCLLFGLDLILKKDFEFICINKTLINNLKLDNIIPLDRNKSKDLNYIECLQWFIMLGDHSW